jgi:hypothetical protein
MLTLLSPRFVCRWGWDSSMYAMYVLRSNSDELSLPPLKRAALSRGVRATLLIARIRITIKSGDSRTDCKDRYV